MMKLPNIAIHNHQFVYVLVLLLTSLGLLSFFNMPRSEDPMMDIPAYSIVAVYPGTSPEDMEELVVDPLEEALNEIEEIQEIQARIEEGVAIIALEGDYALDIDEQYEEITNQVNSVRGELPKDLLSLDVEQFSPLDVVILQLAFVSDIAPYAELVDQAEALEKRLQRVDGVRNTDLAGYPEQEVHISLDMEQLAAIQLPLKQVIRQLQSNHQNMPGGDIDAGTQTYVLKTSGSYESLDALANTILRSDGTNRVRLKDVADVRLAEEDATYLARFQGEKAIFLSLTQQAGKNILSINDQLQAEIDEFAQALPPHIRLERVFEQAPAVEARINDFFMNLLQGVLLVGLIIFLFMGFRNALIIITVIPTAIFIAIFMLDRSDFALQQISIAGLVIALGLLVDNGIVVVENINRFIKQGDGLLTAAAKGSSEVGWAIVSATATTVLAFLPMTQLGGGTGAFLKSLPIIVVYVLLASLCLALVFTPVTSSRWLSAKPSPRRADRYLSKLIEGGYRPLLQFSLRHPLLVLLVAVFSLGGSFALFPLVGISFFPTADKPMIMVDIDLPEGVNLDRTDAATRYVESVLDTLPLVKHYAVNVGHGNPQVYYNMVPQTYKQHHAQVLVSLHRWERERFYPFIDALRAEFATYAGARISVVELKNGPPYEAPIAIKVIGEELDSLSVLAEQVERIIARSPGTLKVDNPLGISKTDLKLRIRQEQAGMMGVPWADIDLAVRTAMTGTEVGTMNTDDGQEYDMRVQMAVEREPRISHLRDVYLSGESGASVPLEQLVQLEFQPGPVRIDHFDLDRTTTLTADVEEGYNSKEVTEAIIAELEQLNWPDDYAWYVAGEYETQQESFGDLGAMLIVAVLGILAILILQFRSFSQPFIVLSAIPLAFSGSVIALFATGYSFSFFAFVGFTSLVGIVINTSIILVDYTNQLIASGLSQREAIQQASETRFTPILLTTLTTILGLLPLTLTNSSLWSPLGWTIIGGMVSSTVLTLLLVPILYQWLSHRQPATA